MSEYSGLLLLFKFPVHGTIFIALINYLTFLEIVGKHENWKNNVYFCICMDIMLLADFFWPIIKMF